MSCKRCGYFKRVDLGAHHRMCVDQVSWCDPNTGEEVCRYWNGAAKREPQSQDNVESGKQHTIEKIQISNITPLEKLLEENTKDDYWDKLEESINNVIKYMREYSEYIVQQRENNKHGLFNTWRKRQEKPIENRRILTYTPTGRNDTERFRLMYSQFFDMCVDATHWCYLEPPKEDGDTYGNL